jgi:branched-chain amino acid transport system ATP-binding protein
MTRFLEVQGLETAYGRSQVLFGIDLAIEAGETVGLMGRNGMGKSTTVRSIMGLVPARAGSIRVGGVEMRGERAHRMAQARLAIVPEGRQVFRTLSVREHLTMAERPAEPGTSAAWDARAVFALFPRLAERTSHLGGQLSGGEQQMLAIGRALMTNPRLIMLDEATEGLAPLVRQEIWGAVRTLKERGTAVLVVDKNIADMAGVADRLLILEKGRLVWSGSPPELRGDFELQRRFLGV